MTKRRNKKQALMASILSLILCVSMLLGTTMAWFTDTVTNTGNRIEMGTLDVDLLMDKEDGEKYVSIADGKGDIFSEATGNGTMWEPGKTQIVFLQVENKGELALNYNIILTVEDLVADSVKAEKALTYAVLPGVTAEAFRASGIQDWNGILKMEGVNVQTGKVYTGDTVAAPNGALEKKKSDYFALAVHMNEDAGNEYQGQALSIDVKLTAKQMASESDSFGNQYDADAKFDTLIKIANEGETVFKANRYSDNTDGMTFYVEYNNPAVFRQNNYLEFQVEIPEDGFYALNTYASHKSGSDVPFKVSIDGVESGSGTVTANGKNFDFSTAYNLGTYELKKGVRTLRITNAGSAGLHVLSFSLTPIDVDVFINEEGETVFKAEEASAYTEGMTFYTEYGNPAVFKGANYFEYKVYIPVDGDYKLNTYASFKEGSDIPFAVSIDGAESGSGAVPANGKWYNFTTASNLGTYTLTKGIHTLRITNSSGTPLHVLSFSLTPDVGILINEEGETVFKAEEASAKTEGMTFYAEKENCAAFKRGNYLEYDIYIPADGYYKLNTYASFKEGDDITFAVSIDGAESGSGAVPANGKWYNFTTASNLGTYEFEKGTHTLRITNASSADLHVLSFSLTPTVKEPMQGEVDTFDYENLDKENTVYKNLYVAETGDDNGDGSESAPFKTVERAVQEVAAINDTMTGDIVVNIAPGYYELSETLELTDAHSGMNGFNVIFRGTDKSSETVISGGTEVTGWEKVENSVLWKAPLTTVSEVRNLYVNDYPAVRARSKYKYTYEEKYVVDGSAYSTDGFLVDSQNFLEFSKPGDLETVWKNSWRQYRVPVEDIIYDSADYEGSAVLVMKNKAWEKANGTLAGYKLAVGSTFYLENAIELLDEKGEFYYDSDEKVIYYYPYDEEDMQNAKTYVGKTETILDIRGESKEKKASNLIFDNLSFKYGAWDEVSTNGIANYQSDAMFNLDPDGGSGNVPNGYKMQSPGQFVVNNAANLTIKNCLFTCLGSSALQFYDAVDGVKVEGNVIRDISGAAVMIGTWLHATENGILDEINGEPCNHFMVSNNVIRRVANEYFSQAAISVYYEANINIVHNDIQNVPYTGITAGWGWEDPQLRSDLHTNINITYNRIADVLEVMNDGSQIYTLGDMHGSTIAYNYLADSHSGMYGGIYLDAGSSNITVHDNVSMNNPRWFFVQSGYAADFNKVYSNYSDTSNWTYTTGSSLGNTTVEEAVLISEGNISAEAQKIIDEAGVEAEYKALLTTVDLPAYKENRTTSAPDSVFGADKYQPTYGWIEAEDYQPGENGVTYYDTVNQLGNNDYRPEGVDLLLYNFTNLEGVKESTRVIQNVTAGEWVTYKVYIPEDGEYDFKLRYGNGSDVESATYYLYQGDETIVQKSGAVPKSAGWYKLGECVFDTLTLEAGEYLLKFEFTGAGFFLDALGFFGDAEIADTDSNNPSAGYDEGVIVS